MQKELLSVLLTGCPATNRALSGLRCVVSLVAAALIACDHPAKRSLQTAQHTRSTVLPCAFPAQRS